MAVLFGLSAARRFHCESNLRCRGAYRELVPGYAVGPLMLLRMKSTFGEPSWFSAGVIPYLFLALENKRKWLSTALLFCVILSMSTSAYVGFPFALALQSFFRRKISTSIVVVVLLFVTAFATLYFVYPETYNQMFTAKMSGDNDSGQVRQDAGAAMKETTATLGPVNRIFGIGFGYYYGGVFYSVLVNTGGRLVDLLLRVLKAGGLFASGGRKCGS